MRKFLLLFFVATMGMAQEQSVDLSLGAGYVNDVFYKLSDGTNSSFERSQWDVAFYRVSIYDQGIRINHGKGLNLYEASSDIREWNTIDASNLEDYTLLYNSDVSWSFGAFNTGSASEGWGVYNSVNHHVIGSVIFLIEDVSTENIYKFMIEDYFGGYTIKYALWNGSSWGADQTNVISNTENSNKFFNYLNLTTNELIDASPAMDGWDLKFTKYSTKVPTKDGDMLPYTVMGVLHNPNVVAAKVEESVDADFADTNTLNFSEDMNTIGYNWKALNSNWKYEIVPDRVFYVKSDDIVYRFYFTSFEGSSTGNLSLNVEKENLSTLDVSGNVKFAVYPNPVTQDQVTLVYDNATNISNKIQVEIYNMTGQKVYETSLNRSAGLFQRTLKLNNLAQGTYILRVISGNDIKSEKLIIK
ncbi:MAG: T9SS type A sorting domain-containing protein [Weeksellaceae bacterium]